MNNIKKKNSPALPLSRTKSTPTATSAHRRRASGAVIGGEDNFFMQGGDAAAASSPQVAGGATTGALPTRSGSRSDGISSTTSNISSSNSSLSYALRRVFSTDAAALAASASHRLSTEVKTEEETQGLIPHSNDDNYRRLLAHRVSSHVLENNEETGHGGDVGGEDEEEAGAELVLDINPLPDNNRDIKMIQNNECVANAMLNEQKKQLQKGGGYQLRKFLSTPHYINTNNESSSSQVKTKTGLKESGVVVGGGGLRSSILRRAPSYDPKNISFDDDDNAFHNDNHVSFRRSTTETDHASVVQIEKEASPLFRGSEEDIEVSLVNRDTNNNSSSKKKSLFGGGSDSSRPQSRLTTEEIDVLHHSLEQPITFNRNPLSFRRKNSDLLKNSSSPSSFRKEDPIQDDLSTVAESVEASTYDHDLKKGRKRMKYQFSLRRLVAFLAIVLLVCFIGGTVFSVLEKGGSNKEDDATMVSNHLEFVSMTGGGGDGSGNNTYGNNTEGYETDDTDFATITDDGEADGSIFNGNDNINNYANTNSNNNGNNNNGSSNSNNGVNSNGSNNSSGNINSISNSDNSNGNINGHNNGNGSNNINNGNNNNNNGINSNGDNNNIDNSSNGNSNNNNSVNSNGSSNYNNIGNNNSDNGSSNNSNGNNNSSNNYYGINSNGDNNNNGNSSNGNSNYNNFGNSNGNNNSNGNSNNDYNEVNSNGNNNNAVVAPSSATIASPAPSEHAQTIVPSNAPTLGTYTKFYVMADCPYNDTERYDLMPAHIEDLSSDVAFAFHLGDMEYTEEDACEEWAYEIASSIIKKSPVPTFVLPGDNDMNDCPDHEHGEDMWKQYFHKFDEHWEHNFELTRWGKFDESFSFVHKGVLYFGLNVVGGAPYSDSEAEARYELHLENVRSILNGLEDDDYKVVVLLAHADPAYGGSHKELFKELSEIFEEVGKPTIHFNGDFHQYYELEGGDYDVENYMRITLDGESIAPPLLVEIDVSKANPIKVSRRRADLSVECCSDGWPRIE